ncbi:MAG: YhcH/YjgK/YiaL family protein [Clostridia bacterium]|nr:YhcH/YjgK/YiaL family protein [Clostridia bacterium]
MHYGTIGSEYSYDLGADKFQKAFAFLKRPDLADLPEGWIELGSGLRASVQRYTTSPAEALAFETHEKYFDLQYLISGKERIGVCHRTGLQAKTAYDEADDITFYEEPPVSGAVLLTAGDYVVLSPADAHKPRCTAGAPEAVRKIVVKVPA